MKVVGVIAEFNPFHNGHAALLTAARECGATHVAVVMSGNYVQRGGPAVLPDRVRAAAAVQCGADLVLQLPLPYAMAGAQRFAQAGVALLEGLGCVDALIFGSECGDLALLGRAVTALEPPAVQAALRSALDSGRTFAAAREAAIRTVDPALADALQTPNNILGAEYLTALAACGSRITPLTVRRQGAAHDAAAPDAAFASGAELRRRMAAGEDWRAFVPAAAVPVLEAALAAGEGPVTEAAFAKPLLAALRMGAVQAEAPDLSEGLEHRLFAAAQTAVTLEELYMLAKTRRYPLARLRRAAWQLLLGITAADAAAPVPYLRPLAFTAAGQALLAAVRTTATLPVLNKPADLPSLSPQAQRCFDLERRAGDLYALCMPTPAPCGAQLRLRPERRN